MKIDFSCRGGRGRNKKKTKKTQSLNADRGGILMPCYFVDFIRNRGGWEKTSPCLARKTAAVIKVRICACTVSVGCIYVHD